MDNKTLDLAFNVSYALQICPPDYVHSILGDPDSWSTKTCPRTEPAERALSSSNDGGSRLKRTRGRAGGAEG